MPSIAAVSINEVMYRPQPESDYYHEYIELSNKKKKVNISGWTLCGQQLTTGYINHSNEKLYATNNYSLGSNSFALITDGGSGTWVYSNYSIKETALAFHPEQASSLCHGSLSGDERLTLKDENGTLIDAVNLSRHETQAGDSLQLLNSNWTSKDPTPGAANQLVSEDPIKTYCHNFSLHLQARNHFPHQRQKITVVIDNRGQNCKLDGLKINLTVQSNASSIKTVIARALSCPASSLLRVPFYVNKDKLGSYHASVQSRYGGQSKKATKEFKLLNLSQYVSNIKINEVLADAGDNFANYTEYIELYNPERRDIPFTGKIKENAGSYSLSLNLKAKGYGLILLAEKDNVSCASFNLDQSCYQLSGGNKLNNGGDDVSLSYKNHTIDRFEYRTANENKSWSWDAGNQNWLLAEPTPARTNNITGNNLRSKQKLTPNLSLARQLTINEIYPQPEGEANEFVEIYNPSQRTVPLLNVSLADAAGNSQELEGKLGANSYHLINYTSILNNEGDQVYLYFNGTNGSLIDSYGYHDSRKGESIARSPDNVNSWQWLPPTPAAPNPLLIKKEVEQEEEETVSATPVTAGRREGLNLVSCPQRAVSGSLLKITGVFYSNQAREGETYSYAYSGHELATEGGWKPNAKQVKVGKGWNLLQQQNSIKENSTGNYSLKLKFKDNDSEFADKCQLTIANDGGGKKNKSKNLQPRREKQATKRKTDHKLIMLDYPQQVEAGSDYKIKALLTTNNNLTGEYYSYIYNEGELASTGGWKANPKRGRFDGRYNLLVSQGRLKDNKKGNYSLKLKLVNNSQNLSLAIKSNIEVLDNIKDSESDGNKFKMEKQSKKTTTRAMASHSNFMETIVAFLTSLWP